MEDRLNELEIKFSHQDLAIEELQNVVFEQHQKIEKLEKLVKDLTSRFKDAAIGAPEIGPGNEKPPHY